MLVSVGRGLCGNSFSNQLRLVNCKGPRLPNPRPGKQITGFATFTRAFLRDRPPHAWHECFPMFRESAFPDSSLIIPCSSGRLKWCLGLENEDFTARPNPFDRMNFSRFPVFFPVLAKKNVRIGPLNSAELDLSALYIAELERVVEDVDLNRVNSKTACVPRRQTCSRHNSPLVPLSGL